MRPPLRLIRALRSESEQEVTVLRVLAGMVCLVILAGCGPAGQPFPSSGARPSPAPGSGVATSVSPTPAPLETVTPGADTATLPRGNVYLDAAELIVRATHPPQVVLSLRGFLPTPCHALRVVVHPPDEQGIIRVEAYSVAKDEEMVCAQVLAPFETQVRLADYPPGHYIVQVNDKTIGEFDG